MPDDEHIEVEQDDDFDYDDCLERLDEERAQCVCGAYQWAEKRGHFVQCADCICGKV